MMAVMSRSKFEAFAAIVNHRPSTLKELASLVGKDLGNISRDVKALEMTGLIELKKDAAGNRLKPIAKYDQIVFDFSTTHKNASGDR